MPIDPDFKVTGRYFLDLLYPVLSPQDARGTGLIKFRYADPNIRGRRVDLDTRRAPCPPPQLRDSRLGHRRAGLRPESLRRLQRQERELQLEMLGEKNMLAAINVAHVPDVRCPTDGGASHCPDNWQIRHDYIIEGTPASRPLQLAVQPRNYVCRFGSGSSSWPTTCTIAAATVVHQLHLLDALCGSRRAGCQNRHLSVQA